ncbi:MAG: SPASM domain-containing protein [Candidatus Krumholzibacteria bacterium]|nr:SPASM domain-containing protein [Candidatus Krumholzibacteria bacterium]
MNIAYLKYTSVGLNFFLKRTRVPAGRVISLTIETTNICNFKCVYCPQSEPAKHFINGKGTMSLATFEKVLDNILGDFTPRFISLHRDGEPLVNKELEAYIAYARSRGVKVGISSNCSLLPARRAESLIDAGLAFIKTDFCDDAETYERLRAGGRWHKTLEGMNNLLAAARARGVRFNMAMTDISTHGVPPEQAVKNMGALRERFADFADWITVMPVHFHNALDESAERLSTAGDGGGYTLCHHPWVHITVDFKGNVVPCCRDLRSEYVCGNLLETPMREIWNGPRFVALREALVEERPYDIGICAKCDLPTSGSYAGRTFKNKVTNLLFGRMWNR